MLSPKNTHVRIKMFLNFEITKYKNIPRYFLLHSIIIHSPHWTMPVSNNKPLTDCLQRAATIFQLFN